jgi:hypothetical protein
VPKEVGISWSEIEPLMSHPCNLRLDLALRRPGALFVTARSHSRHPHAARQSGAE